MLCCHAGGELFDRVVEKTYYSEDDARRVIVVLIELCVYLHERGISHRDLKLENLILKSRDDDAGCGAGVPRRAPRSLLATPVEDARRGIMHTGTRPAVPANPCSGRGRP